MASDEEEPARPRKYKWRYGPGRLILPPVCILVGIFLSLRWLIAPKGADGPLFLFLGIGLIVLGIAAIFVARAMAKRGI